MDTNIITESFNHVLRQRYLPLRHDTTIFALVQIVTEVAFPEQETKYNLSISQTQFYRKPRYQVPSYLEGRPYQVQSLCMLNMERAKSIPYLKLTEERFKPCQKNTNRGEFLFPLEPVHVQHLSPQTFPANTFLQSSVISPNRAGMTCPKV